MFKKISVRLRAAIGTAAILLAIAVLVFTYNDSDYYSYTNHKRIANYLQNHEADREVNRLFVEILLGDSTESDLKRLEELDKKIKQNLPDYNLDGKTGPAPAVILAVYANSSTPGQSELLDLVSKLKGLSSFKPGLVSRDRSLHNALHLYTELFPDYISSLQGILINNRPKINYSNLEDLSTFKNQFSRTINYGAQWQNVDNGKMIYAGLDSLNNLVKDKGLLDEGAADYISETLFRTDQFLKKWIKEMHNQKYDRLKSELQYNYLKAGVFFILGLLLLISPIVQFLRKIKELRTSHDLLLSGLAEVKLQYDSTPEINDLVESVNDIIVNLSDRLVENKEQLELAESALSDEKLRHDEAEKALSKSELLLKEVWNISADGMRISDVDGNIITANEAYCKMVNKKLEDLEGKHFTTIYHDSVKSKFKKFYEEDFTEERVVSHFDRESILWNRKKVWFAFANSHLHTDNGILVLSIIKDITTRKQYEEDIQESAKQLRNLASHLESVREEERRMIAREIHDELGQVLTVLKIQISLLSNKLRDDQSDLKERIKTALSFIDQTVESVQRITAKLRPGILDDLGLVAAIEWQAKDFEERTGIVCELVLPKSTIKLDQEKSTAIFRIFQETLTNVARHANATKVQVRFQVKDKKYVLRITDNGRGISEKEIQDYNSLGLLGMKERAMLLNGEFIITGVPAKGTTVYLNIPIDQESKD